MAVVGRRARVRRVLAVVATTVATASVGIGGIGTAPAGASTEKIQRAQALGLLAFVPESSRPTCNIGTVDADTPVIGPLADDWGEPFVLRLQGLALAVSAAVLLLLVVIWRRNLPPVQEGPEDAQELIKVPEGG